MEKYAVFQVVSGCRDILISIFLIRYDAEVFLKNGDIKGGYIKEVQMCPTEWCNVMDQSKSKE